MCEFVLKVFKKVLIRAKTFFLQKFNMGIKNKLLAKRDGICTFSTFTHVRQTCFAYNFFGAFS